MTISVESLSKRYGEKLAVDSVSFSVLSGEVFAFLGRNGAGKTTTMRMIVGLLRPSAGSVTVDGHDVARAPREAKRRLGFVPDEPQLFDRLTGREFLAFIAELYGVPRADARSRADALVERFELGPHIDNWIESYSHGTKQKVALAGALVHRPANLLLDEPTVGLDPIAAFAMKQTLREHAADGGAVFLSTHILEVAQGLCDRFGIIDGGRLRAVGTLDELRASIAQPEASLEQVFLAVSGARPDHE